MYAYRCVCVYIIMCVWLRSYCSFSPLGLLMFPFIDRTLHWLFYHYPTRSFLRGQPIIMWNPRPSKRTSDEGRTENKVKNLARSKRQWQSHSAQLKSQQSRTHTHTHKHVPLGSAFGPKRECEWCFEHIKWYSSSYTLKKVKTYHWPCKTFVDPSFKSIMCSAPITQLKSEPNFRY